MRRWLLAFLASVILLAGMAGAPALAHKKEHRKQVVTEQASVPAATGPMEHRGPGPVRDEPSEDRSSLSTPARLLDWLGRLHPSIVHFPIALFPAALVAAVVGRRKPAFAAPVRFLVIAGGIVAPIAALLGWFDAGFNPATDDWLLQVHRWMGTGIGIGGLAIALWSWRNPAASSGRTMIAALAIITAAVVVQGWFGGALVHGADHLNW
ncbi:MAG: DUF2231 domain-containing protein [Sphingomicrobium sp.]